MKFIEVEGYKAFNGTMLIKPKVEGISPFALKGDWLYKPGTNCWHGCGRSFMAEICEPIEEEENESE